MTNSGAVKANSRRFNWTVLTLLSLAVVSYSVGQYTTGSLQALGSRQVGLAHAYAGKPLLVQLAFYVHILTGGLALAAGPFQFVPALRRRLPRLHRAVGRVYVGAIALAGPAGLVLACFGTAGLAGFFGFGTVAVLWTWCTYRAYRAAREREFASHQAWMMRSFALTFAAPTLRLWLGLLMGAQALAGTGASADHMYANAYAVVPFLSWLPNLVVAELMIHRRGLPALRIGAPGPR